MNAQLRECSIEPNWPPLGSGRRHVQALMTLRQTAPELGKSAGRFGAVDGGAGLNLGLASGEQVDVVAGNRERLAQALGMPICWINQTHGTTVAEFTTSSSAQPPDADASFTTTPGLALAVLVADCMPILFADDNATCVAVAHAGWRGPAAGIIESTVAALPKERGALHAWLGPVIGKYDFEVGADVVDAFVSLDASSSQAFTAKREGKWCGDLPWLARHRLARLGVAAHGDPPSTLSDPKRFYSYRRDQATGRMAALIWIDTAPLLA